MLGRGWSWARLPTYVCCDGRDVRFLNAHLSVDSPRPSRNSSCTPQHQPGIRTDARHAMLYRLSSVVCMVACGVVLRALPVPELLPSFPYQRHFVRQICRGGHSAPCQQRCIPGFFESCADRPSSYGSKLALFHSRPWGQVLELSAIQPTHHGTNDDRVDTSISAHRSAGYCC